MSRRVGCLLFCLAYSLQGLWAQDFNLNQIRSYLKQKNFAETWKVEVIDNLMFLNIKINQSTDSFRFLIDTGAPMAISQKVVLLVSPKQGRRVLVSSSGVRKDSLNLVLLDSVQIGGLKFFDLVSIVADFTQGEVMRCYAVDGIIGANLMSLAIWQFNQAKEEVTVTDQPKRLSYLKHSAKIPIELWGWQRSPLLTLLINKNLVREKVLFDTGFGDFFSWSRKTFNLVRNRNLLNDTCLIQGKGTAVETIFGKDADSITYKVQLQELDLGGIQFIKPIVDVDLDEGSKIGAEVLREYVVTIDFLHQRLHFYPKGKNIQARRFKSFGFQPYLRDNDVYVAYLYENSPAQRAGIKLYSRVLEINGISLREIDRKNKCELFKQIRQALKDNEEVEVVYADEGETHKVKLRQSVLLGN
jgi:hypothetical protein